MSTTPSVLNAALSSLGSSNSGFDVTATVSAIIEADRAPERAYQAQQATIAKQSAAINQIQSESSSLSDQLFALQDPLGALTYVSASSSDSTVLTATAAPGTASGNHSVVVNGLAATGSSYSNAFSSSSAPVGSGSFTLTANGVSTSFTTGSGSSINTLDDLVSSINSQNLGVTASVVNDLSGSRLALVAAASGTAADFSTSGETGFTFQHAAGANASLNVDGVPISSASNTVKGAISGLTLNLTGTTPTQGGAVQVSLAPNATLITQAVTNFVTAYNTLFSDLKTQFSFNSATGTSGPLAADSAVRSLQEQLLASTNYSSGASASSSLTSLGVTTNQDGTLSVDSTALANTISSNPSALTAFFQGQNADGFASKLSSTLDSFTDPTQGAFTVDLGSLNSQNTALTDETNTLERYLATEQTRLTTVYTKADIALQQLPQQLKQIQTLLGYNNASNGG